MLFVDTYVIRFIVHTLTVFINSIFYNLYKLYIYVLNLDITMNTLQYDPFLQFTR